MGEMSNEALSQAGEIFQQEVFNKYYELVGQFGDEPGKPKVLTPENLRLVIETLWLKKSPEKMLEAFLLSLEAQENEN